MKLWTALAMLMAAVPAPWHHPLYLGNGGIWHHRVRIVVANRGDSAVAGSPVSVRVGPGDGEADIAGAESAALRVCSARGDEMLFEIVAQHGTPTHTGPIPAGARLILPAECPPHGTSDYYLYYDNARAWRVTDYLKAGEGLVNGGMEAGEGDTPAGWTHDAADSRHSATWSTDNPHAGRRCLKTVVVPGADPTWISTRQTGIRIIGGAKYRMTAWVRAAGVVGEAGWYIHLGNAGSPMLAAPMLPAGSGSFDWREVSAEFVAPEAADRADIGTVLRGTGTAWFDDVTLARLDGTDLVSARAAKPERLDVREIGSDAAWRPGPGAHEAWSYRAPIRVTNLSDAGSGDSLISADLTGPLARLRGGVGREGLRVVDNGKAIAHYRLGDLLLFPGTAPARSEHTYRVYLSPSSGGHAAPAAAPSEFAPNPALPGDRNTAQAHMALSEYGALLASSRNLARNASFETGASTPEAWPGAAEGDRPPGTQMGVSGNGLFGPRCARIHVPRGAKTAWVGWRQSIPVKPGRTYLYGAWIRCADVVGAVQIHAHLLTAAGDLVKQGGMTGAGPALSGTQGWTLLSGLFSVPEDCSQFHMHLTMNATGTVWHDGVVLMEVVPGEVGGIEARPATTERVANATPAIWQVNALVKVFREDTPPSAPIAAVISSARNEREPLQVAVRSPRAMAGVSAVVSAPLGPGGATLRRVEVAVVGYVPIDHATNYYSSKTPAYYRKTPTGPAGSDGWSGWWPDPLLPRSKFELEANRTQPLWITVTVPRNAAPGDYRSTLRLTAGGVTLASLPFTVHVWKFTLPEQRHVKAIFDTRQSGPMWRVPGKSEQESRVAFWEFLAERHVCPDQIQPEPVFTYRDGRVTADFEAYDRAAEIYFGRLKFPHSYTPGQFYLFGWGHLPAEKFGEKPYEGEYPYVGVDRSQLRPAYKRAYQACFKAYWDHVKAKGWADRITMYISDEPYDSEAPVRAQMKALCNMVHEVDPAIRIYSSTWHHQPEWDGYLNVWGFGHYGIVPVKKMQEVKAGGATLWWTTDGMMCTDTPYCAIERLLPHYCFKFGADAYEFWGIDWLTYNPYEYGWHAFLPHDFGPNAEKEWVRYPNGDGFLAYPPGPLKLTRPVSSIRLEQASEGLDDYEYLYLLRELVRAARSEGRDVAAGQAALAVANDLVQSPCDIGRYSTRILPDPDRVFRVRTVIARAIEKMIE